jgi:AraC-like DNA-binding protein
MYSAHLDRPFVEERFAAVEGVDPHWARADLVDDPLKQREVQHPRLPVRANPGFRRSTTRSGKSYAAVLDEHPWRGAACLQRPHDRRHLSPAEFQRTVAAEGGTALIEVLTQRRHDRAVRPLQRWPFAHLRARVSVGVGAATDEAAVAQHDQPLTTRPAALETTGKMDQRHGYFLDRFFMYDRDQLSFLSHDLRVDEQTNNKRRIHDAISKYS